MLDRFATMQIFVRAFEGGSLSAAARASGRSLAAVSRTVSELEARLGVQLLRRTTRRLVPTEAGTAYYEAARKILGEVDEAEAGIGSARTEPRGLLTVTAPLMFGRLHVAPVLNDFLAHHRQVAGRLTLTDRNINLVEEGVDVAVRIGRLSDSSLVARPLGSVDRIVCASPAYLRRHGTPKVPIDLKDHECLRFTGLTPGREWTFAQAGRELNVAISGRFSCNVVDPAVDAAVAGQGVLQVLDYQVSDHLAAGSLVRILKAFEPPSAPVSALYLSPRLLAARVRGFLDHLATMIPHRLGVKIAAFGEGRRDDAKS